MSKKQFNVERDSETGALEEILENLMSTGDVLAGCPHCNNFVSNKEYINCFCETCKKKINFKNFLYYPGPEKENN